MDRGVIATASELFEARHFPGVVAMCTDALDDEPECVPLLLIRARARIALRRDLDAQGDLRDVIRLDPRCSIAYRLLGELAARQDENDSAAVFFREALRLDPDDHEAHDWLMVVGATPRPASEPRRWAPTPLETPRRPSQVRLARGTQPPDQGDHHNTPGDERPTKPFGRILDPGVRSEPVRTAARPPVRPTPTPEPLPPPPAPGPGFAAANERPNEPPIERPTLSGRPATQPPARPAPRLTARGQAPELPGFGEYLVSNGILTRERLRAAQAYQRSMKVQLSTAIVTLGLASPQRIQWAAVAHQSQQSRPA
ncbi:MAG TPA: tetratricopeptide repeat protein [Kofleriaceae bacterium]|nr:tetratricopeptide repeat protein [Kofleriaceae bacterium]